LATALYAESVSSGAALLDLDDGSTAFGPCSAAVKLPGSGKVLWLAESDNGLSKRLRQAAH